nr:unnamed protein product [Callosobruchus analis]
MPGKNLIIPDTLSRGPLKTKMLANEELETEVNAYVQSIFLNLIKKEQEKDFVCKKLKEFSITSWPDKSQLPVELLPYYQYSLQLKVLGFIHTGHLGIVKCRERAKSSVWWIGLSTQIDNLVTHCPQCVEYRENHKETFYKDKTVRRPWQKLGVDFCKCDNIWYMIVVDYYSRWFEIFVVTNMTEEAIIPKPKELFSRYGIPEEIRSDGGPQFSSKFLHFAKEYNFVHTKKLLFKRKLRSNLPQLPSLLEKQVNVNMSKSEEIKHKQVRCYNKRHNAKDMSPLKIGDSVWVVDIKKYGKVIEICPEPRSYIIQTELGKYRRNRWHLIYAPYYFPNSATHTEELECLDNNSEVRSAGTSEEFTNTQCQGLGMRNEIEGGKESVEDGNNLETDVNFSRPKRSVKSHLIYRTMLPVIRLSFI